MSHQPGKKPVSNLVGPMRFFAWCLSMADDYSAKPSSIIIIIIIKKKSIYFFLSLMKRKESVTPLSLLTGKLCLVEETRHCLFEG